MYSIQLCKAISICHRILCFPEVFFGLVAKKPNKCYNIHMSLTHTKDPPLETLEREMVIAGILWVMFAGICVVAANAWAALF